MIFKIEKNVKMPGARVRAVYPFEKMAVGDSFFVPATDKAAKNASRNRVSVACCKAGKKLNPKKFTCRSVMNGLRVWRVA